MASVTVHHRETKPKLKNAPHLTEQPNEPFSDMFILAGEKAWASWNNGKGQEWLLLCDHIRQNYSQKPVILGETQLDEINRLRLARQEQRAIKIFQMGALSEAQKTAICLNLANYTHAKQVALYGDLSAQFEKLENLSPTIERYRQDDSARQLAETIAQSQNKTERKGEGEKEGENSNLNSEYADYFRTLSDDKKITAFLEWFAKPMCTHDLSQTAYFYTGKKWQALARHELGRLVRDFFKLNGIGYSWRKLDSLLDLLEYELNPMGERNKNLLAFANGTLNKQTGEFRAHSQEDFLTSFIDIDYPESEAPPTPNFDKWLKWVSDGDTNKAERILAGLYMILTNRHEWQLFLEITGAGGTGKSVFNELAKILAGEDNTASISLKELESPVIRCKLIDKTLFYSADQEAYIGDGAELRAITGGDALGFNPKYKAPFDAKVDAVFMMTGNTAIIFKENKGGIARRRVIYHFKKAVPDEIKDDKLIHKLKQEAGGIVRLLLDAFPDPRTAKARLLEQRASSEALEVKQESDHILDFSRHFITKELINGLHIGSARQLNAHRTALYCAYLYYCECLSRAKPLNKAQFLNAFKQAIKEQGRTHEFNQRRSNGHTVTNVYYINVQDSLDEWGG